MEHVCAVGQQAASERLLPAYQHLQRLCWHRIKERKAYESAKNSAAGMLTWRPHSQKELRDKLSERGHAADSVAAALDRLSELVGDAW